MAGAAVMAYGVRGRSAQVFGPSVYRGDPRRKAIALTFDDGPSESTPRLLEVLARHSVPATFFQCGANIRRLPGVAREVLAAGHEIGNHTDTHPHLYFRDYQTIHDEFLRAQITIEQELGISPRLMRPPYGVRWFGFRSMQETLNLLGVLWTVIGLDWKRNAEEITVRVLRFTQNGAIICLHDGRSVMRQPDIHATIDATSRIIPALTGQGYVFQTVTELLCLKK